MTKTPVIGHPDSAPTRGRLTTRRRGAGRRPVRHRSFRCPVGGAWVSRTGHWPGAPRLGLSAATRANDWYGEISVALITPSSIARASSASLLAAVRPLAAYLARARLMYWRTVFSLIAMRRPTDAFDMPWNHSSSA